MAGVRTGLAPYLPFSTAALDDLYGPVERWERPDLPAGTAVPKPEPLFAKVDLDAIDLAGNGTAPA